MAGGKLLPAVTRQPGAAEAFAALLAERWAQPFAWGGNDCCLWAADAVRVLTGVDFAAEFRGTYSDAMGAGRLIRRLGGLQVVATGSLGEPMAYPMQARLGDVGLTHSGALAVCIGEWWSLPGEKGLGLLPLCDAEMAWRVG